MTKQFVVSVKQDDDTRHGMVYAACDALIAGKYPKIFIEGTDLYIKLGPINQACRYATDQGYCLDTFQGMVPSLFAKSGLPEEHFKLFETVCYDAYNVL